MNNEYEVRNDYDKLVGELELLIDGRHVNAIIPALTVILGSVLAETGQDKIGSLEYISHSVIEIYETHNTNNKEH